MGEVKKLKLVLQIKNFVFNAKRKPDYGDYSITVVQILVLNIDYL